MARLDEIVLHVDYEQRGGARVDGVERVQLADPRVHAVEAGLRDSDLAHRRFLN